MSRASALVFFFFFFLSAPALGNLPAWETTVLEIVFAKVKCKHCPLEGAVSYSTSSKDRWRVSFFGGFRETTSSEKIHCVGFSTHTVTG